MLGDITIASELYIVCGLYRHAKVDRWFVYDHTRSVTYGAWSFKRVVSVLRKAL